MTGSSGKSQKEGQEDQGTFKQLEGLAPGSLIRPFKGLIRPFKGLIRPFKGLLRPFKGLIRPLKGLRRPLKGLIRPLKGLIRPLKGLIREPGASPSSCLKVPWSSWPSFWLFPELPVNP